MFEEVSFDMQYRQVLSDLLKQYKSISIHKIGNQIMIEIKNEKLGLFLNTGLQPNLDAALFHATSLIYTEEERRRYRPTKRK